MRAYLGLGTNVGDLRGNLEFARRRLELGGAEIVAASREEVTAPVGGVEQADFLNQVVAVETELEPRALLQLAKSIETDAGRPSGGIRWGPRVLDIDILLYGEEVTSEPDLVIPHPELRNREFVVRELLEVGAVLPE